jgi:hypothetical protein
MAGGYFTSHPVFGGKDQIPPTSCETSCENNSEPQNFEGWFRFAQSFFKTDRIHSFDIRYSLFKVAFSIKPAARGQRRRL